MIIIRLRIDMLSPVEQRVITMWKEKVNFVVRSQGPIRLMTKFEEVAGW